MFISMALTAFKQAVKFIPLNNALSLRHFIFQNLQPTQREPNVLHINMPFLHQKAIELASL